MDVDDQEVVPEEPERLLEQGNRLREAVLVIPDLAEDA